jgi:hypothetical protein
MLARMDQNISQLLEQHAISDVVTRFFRGLDTFDTDTVRAAIGDEFTLDAGAVLDQAPAPVPVDEFIEGLVARNWGFTHTVHMHPDHFIEIDGATARVYCHMWASHLVGDGPDEYYACYGDYEIDLVRGEDWRMSKLTILIRGLDGGDPARIYEIAARRQADGEGH